MKVENLWSFLVGAIVRQWWLIALTVVVAAGVGFFATSGAQTEFTGRATVVIDSAVVSKGSGIPEAEPLLKNLQSDRFFESAAAAAGMTPSELSSGSRVYTTGTPQDRLITEYTSPDQDLAEKTAAILAQAAVDEARAMGKVELDKQAAIVENTRAAIADLEQFKGSSEWERTDVVFKVWQLKKDLASGEAALTLAERAYVYDGNTKVSQTVTASRDRMSSAVAAAFAGLIAGLALALIRERRRMQAAGA
ncbi:MAG: hypothetical protein CVT66_02515 [Actinobacteria bacterium HGW-Actinobacteria-6]|nr:MAG: hypothetical protein CVT66_02515 [Actinobacteria bacterium HGW-Actinobacteria-6]